jgi:anti-anti-sigma regulatory factor
MKITISKIGQPSAVTVLHLDGTLDGSNHQCLVEEAQMLYEAGTCDLILDLSNLTFISSAGLGAIHQVALLFHGKKHPDKDETWGAYRWAAYRSIDGDHKRKTHEHVKLLSPSKEVLEVLDLIGFTSLFEIYTDIQQAAASFYEAAPVAKVNMQ